MPLISWLKTGSAILMVQTKKKDGIPTVEVQARLVVHLELILVRLNHLTPPREDPQEETLRMASDFLNE